MYTSMYMYQPLYTYIVVGTNMQWLLYIYCICNHCIFVVSGEMKWCIIYSNKGKCAQMLELTALSLYPTSSSVMCRYICVCVCACTVVCMCVCVYECYQFVISTQCHIFTHEHFCQNFYVISSSFKVSSRIVPLTRFKSLSCKICTVSFSCFQI